MKMKIVQGGWAAAEEAKPGQGGHGSPGPVIIDTKEMTYTIDFLLIPFSSVKCCPTDLGRKKSFFGEEGTFYLCQFA